MLNLIICFFLALSTFSFSSVENYLSEKAENDFEISQLLKDLPKEKLMQLLSVKKNIMTDEINFRNRFIELRSSANRALKDKNEKKYKCLMSEIGILKNERNLLRTYHIKEIEGILGIKIPNFYKSDPLFESSILL
ncbi:hypothetical protein [Fusobacterium sp.]|uniref:hypothetical protein n=1 Tax=Fusobacterium sp. TaxID=68766 RepID=UPI0026266605|nr:hypothetical protein [Fusobacterium sp.]